MIIFADQAETKQIWQWVKRESNQPVRSREQRFDKDQSGESLIQKLVVLQYTLEEEENASIVNAKAKVTRAFDTEKVTKRFYDRFQKERKKFQTFISGIEKELDMNWYTSITLNRLMFVYFIQKKGFLDGDNEYLRNRLSAVQSERGENEFHTFYRYFLRRLFHEGLGGQNHSPELEKLLGMVPYLNGGLFDVHELEKKYSELDIPDEAFEKIFDFFDAYDWHLDERPLHKDNEINPDVLGYIFEKYINQKQMGAYYTKEDITDYIGKNTIIPYLFDQAKKDCRVAFENPAGKTVWDLLKENPLKYIYEAMTTGVFDEKGNLIPEDRLPDFVQEGMHDPKARMFENRYNRQTAGNDYVETLPTETWREYVNRRNRCIELVEKLHGGEITGINDLITFNLDIRQFAQDVLENWEGSDLIKAFWKEISEVTVLDPTCGSGAFLFAALNILEPLYEACLQRMESFVQEHPDPKKYEDVRKILDSVNRHPNLQYFIYKSIILNNLYGVDIMDEAVEICKLRLFLKLAAQVEPDNSKANYGLEPLPDIDFNIRAGNTLVGFATEDSLKSLVEADMRNVMDGTWDNIKRQAQDVQQAFDIFRKAQTEGDGKVPPEHKQQLRSKLRALENELNHYLAVEYSVNPKDKAKYESWLTSHKPFHWFIEFHGIMRTDGFDVIIGNPPYVEYREVVNIYNLSGYNTISCGNLYAMVTERCLQILKLNSRTSMIVQLPLVCTDRMRVLQDYLNEQSSQIWFSTYDDRLARLFDGLEHIRATIFTLKKSPKDSNPDIFTSIYHRWYSENRDSLFQTLSYAKNVIHVIDGSICKSGNSLAMRLLGILNSMKGSQLGLCLGNSDEKVFYHNAPQYWVRAMITEPYFWNERDGHQLSKQVKLLSSQARSLL